MPMLGRLFLCFLLFAALAAAHEPPQFAGNASVSLSSDPQDSMVLTLAITNTTQRAGMAVTLAFDNLKVVIQAAVGRASAATQASPVAPYVRVEPSNKGDWWFVVTHNLTGVSVNATTVPAVDEEVQFFIDHPQLLDNNVPSRYFDIASNGGFELFSYGTEGTLEFSFLPGGVGVLDANAANGNSFTDCDETFQQVCFMSSYTPRTRDPWVIVVTNDQPENQNNNTCPPVALDRQVQVRVIPELTLNILPNASKTERFWEPVLISNHSFFLRDIGGVQVYMLESPPTGAPESVLCNFTIPALGISTDCGDGMQATIGSSISVAQDNQNWHSVLTLDPIYGIENKSAPWFARVATQSPVGNTSCSDYDCFVTFRFPLVPSIISLPPDKLQGAPHIVEAYKSTSPEFFGVWTLGYDKTPVPEPSWSTGISAQKMLFGAEDAGTWNLGFCSGPVYLTTDPTPADWKFRVNYPETTIHAMSPNQTVTISITAGSTKPFLVNFVNATEASTIISYFPIDPSQSNFDVHYCNYWFDSFWQDNVGIFGGITVYAPLINSTSLFISPTVNNTDTEFTFRAEPVQTFPWKPGPLKVAIPPGRSVLTLKDVPSDASWYSYYLSELSEKVNMTLLSPNTQSIMSITDQPQLFWGSETADGIRIPSRNNIMFVLDTLPGFKKGSLTLEMGVAGMMDPSGKVVVPPGTRFAMYQQPMSMNRNTAAIDYFVEPYDNDNLIAIQQDATPLYPLFGTYPQNYSNYIGIGNGTFYFALIIANTSRPTTVGISSKFAAVVCSNEYTCLGHGSCPNSKNDSTLAACNCIGFNGEFCDVRNARVMLFLLLVGIGIALYAALYALFIHCRAKKRKSRDRAAPESVELLAPEDGSAVVSGALITFENLQVDGRLADVSGDFRPGELSIIMGGSGAGKSSLLAALLGNLAIDSGTIYYNGAATSLAAPKYRASVGFVPQHDTLLESLSVKENIYFAANLRLSTTRQVRHARVKYVLQRLHLWHVRHSIVSSISGGQRRRTSMAMELVTDPSVLFLDEVTSGLDSESAILCMQILSELARDDGKTIVVVIHQPSFKIMKLVDHQIILRLGGRVGWNGPGVRDKGAFRAALPEQWVDRKDNDEAEEEKNDFDFLESGDNVADWMLEKVIEMDELDGSVHTAVGETDDHRRARCNELALSPNVKVPKSRLPNPMWQFLVFGRQSLVELTRGWVRLAVAMALVVVSALLLGFVFRDQLYVGPVDQSVASQCPAWLAPICKRPRVDPIPSWASMIALAIGLTSLATSIEVFLPEWEMIKRQRRAGVNIISYVTARNLADGIPNIFIPPLLFSCIFYYFKQPMMSFLDFYIVVVVTQFTTLGLGYMASLIAQPAPFLSGCVLVLISIAFSGVQPTLSQLNSTPFIGIISQISFARWTIEAIYIQETAAVATIYNIQPGLDALSYGTDATTPLLILFLLGVAFRVIAALTYTAPWLLSKWDRIRQRWKNRR